MTGSIASHMEEYLRKNIYPMHMPGHKRNGKFFADALYRYDLTEIPGMDNLHAPSGVIDEAQKRMAAFYGADWTCFLINGSTAGVTAAIAAVCGENDTVIVDRNSHRSVFGGLVLSGARPVYIWPEVTDFGLPGGICPEQLDKILLDNKGVKAVVITSPTYEGFVSDICAIAEVVHRHDAVLIVDEAHGAHFPFYSLFPPSALSMGADVAVNSLHKTLPLPSQCAVVHGKGGRVDSGRMQLFLSIIQSSSPSYLFMMLMDQTMTRLQDDSRYFECYAERLMDFRSGFARRQSLELIGEEIVGKWSVKALDVGKLAFVINGELDGPQLEKRLAESYGVQLELSGPKHILAMTSVADEAEGFDRLARGIREIGNALAYQPVHYDGFAMYKPEVVYTLRQAIQKESASIDLKDAVGLAAADFIIPYPPGTPIAAPGERLTIEIIARVIDLHARGITVLGAEDNRCKVIKDEGGRYAGRKNEI